MKVSRQGSSKLQTAKEKIKAYLLGDEIELNPAEISILSRWEKADLMYRQRVSFEDIIKTLTEPPYSISRFTAQNDLFNAMEIFAAARKLNKKYILFLKYQQQQADADAYRLQIFFDDKGKKIKPDPKEITALAKLEEAATYTLNSLPKDDDKPPFVPTKVILNLVDEDAIPLETSLAESLKLADSYLKSLPELIAEPIQKNGTAGDQ